MQEGRSVEEESSGMDKQRFAEVIEQFKSSRDCNGDRLNMHYFLVKRGNEINLHRFDGRTAKSDIRSISKTVMALVAGIVNRLHLEGRGPELTVDTLVYPVIRNVIDLTNHQNEHRLRKVTVEHLLTHAVGFGEVLLMRGDIAGLDPEHYLDHVVNSPIAHEPGEHFLYSNAGCYMLSVFLQELLQEDLREFVRRELFSPLGIEDFRWERYGNYLAGATRLWLHPEDLMRIGDLILNNGVHNGRRIVPEAWITDMRRARYRTESYDTPGTTFRRYAYGLGGWVAKEGFYFGHGTDGQILTVLPERDYVVVALAHQHDMKPIEKIVDQVVSRELS